MVKQLGTGVTNSNVETHLVISGPKLTVEDFTRANFSDAHIRNGFIRKVYLILFSQLLVSGGFIALCTLLPVICVWIRHHPIFLYVSYGVFFATYITLACCTSVRRKVPGNFLALFIFTLAFSYVAGAISCSYGTISVLSTVVITAATCLLVSLFAATGWIDFTKCTALLLVLSIGLILFGLACMVVYLVLGPNKILHTVYGGVAACVFILYLIYDTQMIIGGGAYDYSPEEYIFGALQLYMDIMNLFLLLLGLMGNQD
ncbi:unnamed protein product [Dicrocoelium dendriticum]|nr:unnamed protein product [Dicrocoelium dendriticum]